MVEKKITQPGMLHVEIGDLVSVAGQVLRIVKNLTPNGLFVEGENIETFEREMLTTAQIPSPRIYIAKRGMRRRRVTKRWRTYAINRPNK